MEQLFTCFNQRPDVNCSAPVFATLDESRRQPRSHVFVAATLLSDLGSAPVHIRNMSQSGALIEASLVPDPGAAVILKRGSLHVAGQIAWKAERKAGLAFSTEVNVADWLSRPMGAHQERVDGLVSSLRAGRQADGAAGATNVSSVASIVAELATLRADIVQLGNGLANDAILVATHPEIQMIDIALQRVDRIIGQLRNT